MSELPDRKEITPEVVAIGLNEKGKFSGQPPRAKVKNFRPDNFKGRLELSSFCMDSLQEVEKWEILDSVSDKPPIPARAELTKEQVGATGLTLDPDWEPERHVNIVGWSGEDDEQTRAAQALRAVHGFVPRSKDS